MTFRSLSNSIGNEKGFAVPLVIILATVGAILVLSMSDSIMSSVGLTSSRNQVTTYESFVENLKNVVEDPYACTVMLRGTPVDLGLNVKTPVARLNRDFDASNNSDEDLYPGWTDPENAFGIDRMEIQMMASELNHVTERMQKDFENASYAVLQDPALKAAAEPARNYAYPARFIVHPSGIHSKLLNQTGVQAAQRFDVYEKNSDGSEKLDADGRKIPRINPVTGKPYALPQFAQSKFEDANAEYLSKGRIDMRIFVNVELVSASKGIVKSCYGYKSDASVCAASGGTYQYIPDPSDPFPDIKCKPYKKCFTSPAGLVNSEAACKAPYDAKDGDGNFLFAKTVGKLNGVDKFLCNWCHPFADTVKDLKMTVGGSTMDNWLEQEWLRLAAMALDLMPSAPDPLDPALDPELMKKIGSLMMEWTYLENTTVQSGLAIDTQSEEYLLAEAAVQKVEDLTVAKVAQQDQINNLNLEIDDLQDELDAMDKAGLFFGFIKPSAADVAKAQAEVDAAQAAYDTDPSPENLATLNDRKSDYDSVYAMANDPNIKQTTKDKLDQAKADLANAQTIMADLVAQLAAAQAEVDGMTLSTGQSVSEFLDPINAIKQMLINDYNIDESVIAWADAARGL